MGFSHLLSLLSIVQLVTLQAYEVGRDGLLVDVGEERITRPKGFNYLLVM